MPFFETIGRGIDAFCSLVWKGLQAVWGLIKKVVSTIIGWTISIVGWLVRAAIGLSAAITAGVIVFFIWIFGDDEDGELEPQNGGESQLGRELGKRLNDPNRPIITVKGVFNKQTGELHKNTEIESSNNISTSVTEQTGGRRFAELKAEE